MEVAEKSFKNSLTLSLQSCDSWMFVKENPDLSGYQPALRNQGLPVWVRPVALCRGELSAVITWVMSKCQWSSWSSRKQLKNSFPLPLQSCNSWIFVKENLDRRKKVFFSFFIHNYFQSYMLFYERHFYKQRQAELLLSEDYSVSSFTLSPWSNRRYSKNVQRTSISA